VIASCALAQALLAADERDEARAVAEVAVRAAYATQQTAERARADAVAAEIG